MEDRIQETVRQKAGDWRDGTQETGYKRQYKRDRRQERETGEGSLALYPKKLDLLMLRVTSSTFKEC